MRSWCTLPLLLLAACHDATPPAPLNRVTDSAGIQLVTNLPAPDDPRPEWTLSAEPVIRIGGGPDPEVPLVRVTAVAPLGGGRVAVGVGVPPHVVVFGEEGDVLATIGREGDGPGEFARVGSVLELRDSVAVWDPYRRRLSVFSADGSFLRDVDLSTLAPMAAASAGGTGYVSGYTRLLPLEGGHMALFGEGVMGPAGDPGVDRPELPAYRIGPEGQEMASYGTFPGMEVIQPGGIPRPFGRRAHAAVVGDELVVGTADRPELRVFAPTGELRRIVRWPEADRAVEGARMARWLRHVDTRPGMSEMVQDLPLPDEAPAHAELVSTDDGFLLVAEDAGPLGIFPLRRGDDAPEALRPEARVPTRRWWVLDGEGVLRATVLTPEGFEPVRVRNDLVWGVYTDELDAESVRAYRLTREGR